MKQKNKAIMHSAHAYVRLLALNLVLIIIIIIIIITTIIIKIIMMIIIIIIKTFLMRN